MYDNTIYHDALEKTSLISRVHAAFCGQVLNPPKPPAGQVPMPRREVSTARQLREIPARHRRMPNAVELRREHTISLQAGDADWEPVPPTA
jgi:hypothetical protein